jgi:hypothetical protein
MGNLGLNYSERKTIAPLFFKEKSPLIAIITLSPPRRMRTHLKRGPGHGAFPAVSLITVLDFEAVHR